MTCQLERKALSLHESLFFVESFKGLYNPSQIAPADAHVHPSLSLLLCLSSSLSLSTSSSPSASPPRDQETSIEVCVEDAMS